MRACRTVDTVYVLLGVEVLQLYASDPDNGLNGSVTFSLAEQSQLFAVSVSGRITTVAPASSFDRETRDTHYLIVHASDAGNPPNTGMFFFIQFWYLRCCGCP